jgi:gliding motility-associated-like protein
MLTITEPICYGQSNASIGITAAGGTPAYTYSLNGAPYIYTVAFLGLTAGTDTIRIKDANGCLYDTTITINQPTQVAVASIAGTDVLCHGGADGTITINGSGGVPLYQYSGDGSIPLPGPTLTGFAAGVHTVRVKDSHGCYMDTSIALSEPPVLTFSLLDIITPTCEGYKNGVVTLHGTGGVGPYQYSNDNINYSASNIFSTIPEGTYTFYVKDAHNCVADTTIMLVGYPHIIIDTVNIANPTCTGNSDAVIAIKPSGGNPPFTFSITGNTSQIVPGVFNKLPSGTYTIIITDSTGCKKDTVITIAEPDTMRITTVVTPNDCYGNDNNGIAAVSVAGGNPPYKYQWSAGAGVDSMIIGKANDIYMVWVTDHNYCVDSATVRIGYDDCCIPYVPNAFSPNNDGKNDVFRLKYKGDIRIIEFSVFNRYGERVFTTSYTEDGWDGTYKGEPSDIGTYYYYVRLLCGNLHNNVQEFKGNVTLVR